MTQQSNDPFGAWPVGCSVAPSISAAHPALNKREAIVDASKYRAPIFSHWLSIYWTSVATRRRKLQRGADRALCRSASRRVVLRRGLIRITTGLPTPATFTASTIN
jgi:hypothetical protein